MSIYGVNNSNITRLPTQAPVRDNRTPAQKPATTSLTPSVTPTSANPKVAQGGQTGQAVPVDPPPGTDPALWSILSSEERSFFAKAGAMGPLTYGRAFSEMKSAQPPAARGGRLDVKI
jgi:hypothetical protein